MLVDQFGGLDDALAWAATAAKLKQGDWQPVYLGADTSPYSSLLHRLIGGGQQRSLPTGDLAAFVSRREAARVGQALNDVGRIMRVQGIQAYCLECGGSAAPAAAPDRSLIALAARALGITAD